MALSDGIQVLKVAEKGYHFARYICVECDARYGKPEPHGWIDLKDCPPCAQLKEALRIKPTRKRRKDYL